MVLYVSLGTSSSCDRISIYLILIFIFFEKGKGVAVGIIPATFKNLSQATWRTQKQRRWARHEIQSKGQEKTAFPFTQYVSILLSLSLSLSPSLFLSFSAPPLASKVVTTHDDYWEENVITNFKGKSKSNLHALNSLQFPYFVSCIWIFLASFPSYLLVLLTKFVTLILISFFFSRWEKDASLNCMVDLESWPTSMTIWG